MTVLNSFSHVRPFKDTFQPRGDEMLAGLYLYMLRLNAKTKQRVETSLKEALPCDLDPERTISLPIRASDKCIDDYRLASTFEVRGILRS
jgi:hypothetical protein